MGNRMICATSKICSGAVVAQVAQKAGLRHCATGGVCIYIPTPDGAWWRICPAVAQRWSK